MQRDIASESRERPSAFAFSDWWRNVAGILTPLWVGGVATLCLLLAWLTALALVPFVPRAGVWAPYLALGTLFPVIVAAVVLWQRADGRFSTPIATGLCMLPVLAVLASAGPLLTALAMALAQIQTLVTLLVFSRQTQISATRAVSLLVYGFIAWAVALELFAWEPMVTVLPPSWPLVIIGAVALVPCCWWAFGETESGSGRFLVDAAAIAILVLLAFRTDGLFTTDRLGEDGTFYHWGALVAPAEAVRQGGWLLWDVPSPYGFLTTLTLAALPVATSWQALYLLNGAASAALAFGLYATFRARQPGPAGALFALAVSAAVVFLVSTYPPTLAPEHYFPMAGAFRYGWSYLLVGVLLLERSSPPGSPRQIVALLAGCLCWLLSMLWSAESAFVGSAIWLPAYMFIVLRDHGVPSNARSWRRLLAWLLAPPLFLLLALGAIALMYQRFLGHGPDALAYVESVFSFAGSRVIEATGGLEDAEFTSTIAVGIFGLVLLATAAASIAKTMDGLRDLPLSAGLAFGFWSLLSYPIGTRFLFAIFRLMPFLILGLALVLTVLVHGRRTEPDGHWIDLMKNGTIALLTGLLTITYTNLPELQFYANAIRTEPFLGRNVADGLPAVEPSLQTLMQRAGVAASDPIFYAGGAYGESMPTWLPVGTSTPVVNSRQWMAGPLSAMVFLPDDRKQTFMRRSSDRHPAGGWLIERRQQDDLVFALDSWFFEQVNRSHVPTRLATNDDWQLVWYEPIGASELSMTPLPGSERMPATPSDLRITGAGSPDGVSQEIWGFFGPEWSEPTAEIIGRCADSRGTLRVFSDAPSEPRLILGLPESANADSPRVSVNGGELIEMELTRTGKRSIVLPLQAGWNDVVIESASAGADATAANPSPTCEPDDGVSSPLTIDYFEIRLRE